MGAKELIMLDEGNEDKEDPKNVSIVLSDNCMLNGNIITIPANEALSIVANIAIQMAMLV